MSATPRKQLPFRSVNRPRTESYDPALQRHHLLPCQLLSRRCFRRLFDALGTSRIGFEDFRRNGLLLPARMAAARRLALPLHRGPHRTYNEMVIERVGQIEAHWVRAARVNIDFAGAEALFRLGLVQRALRRRLLVLPRGSLVLNRRDPLGSGYDFTELDAMAEQLWGDTQIALAASSSFAA